MKKFNEFVNESKIDIMPKISKIVLDFYPEISDNTLKKVVYLFYNKKTDKVMNRVGTIRTITSAIADDMGAIHKYDELVPEIEKMWTEIKNI